MFFVLVNFKLFGILEFVYICVWYYVYVLRKGVSGVYLIWNYSMDKILRKIRNIR